MLLINLQTTLQLCSRCLSNEITSWVNEKWAELDEKTKKQVREELTTVRLVNGKCIVCNNTLISENTAQNILKILEQNNVDEKIKKEFGKFFCFGF